MHNYVIVTLITQKYAVIVLQIVMFYTNISHPSQVRYPALWIWFSGFPQVMESWNVREFRTLLFQVWNVREFWHVAWNVMENCQWWWYWCIKSIVAKCFSTVTCWHDHDDMSMFKKSWNFKKVVMESHGKVREFESPQSVRTLYRATSEMLVYQWCFLYFCSFIKYDLKTNTRKL